MALRLALTQPSDFGEPPMQRVALLYNPASGQHASRRAATIADVLGVLRNAGVEAEAIATSAPGSAGAQALEAVQRGCDTILACGGDGTVHEILQCLVGTPVALGVVPQGTANALAASLGLGSSPVRAVKKLLRATPVRVPVGHIFYRNSLGAQCSRYFTVTAGVGADALLMSRMDARLKRRLGYVLYLIEGLRIMTTHTFPLFETTFRLRGGRKPRVEEVSQILAVRIRDFGGVLHNLAPGATLHKDNLRLVAFKTRSRLHYLLFILAVLVRRQTFFKTIEVLDAASVECRPIEGTKAEIFVEADGELLGTLPARIEIMPHALTLLIPRRAHP